MQSNMQIKFYLIHYVLKIIIKKCDWIYEKGYNTRIRFSNLVED